MMPCFYYMAQLIGMKDQLSLKGLINYHEQFVHSKNFVAVIKNLVPVFLKIFPKLQIADITEFDFKISHR